MKLKALILALLFALSVLPAFAQDDTTTTNTVAFNGFSFSYDSTIASNVNITQVAGDPLDSPFPPEAAHTQFLLYTGYPAPESFLDAVGGIRIYRTADLLGNEARESQLIQLQSLLSQRPDLAEYMNSDTSALGTLPFFPIFPAGQILRARAQYIENDSVSGIAYLVVYSEAPGTLIGSDILYTFQGVSNDGEYYVSAIFHAAPSILPAEYEAIDPATFDMNAYVTDLIVELNAATPEDFAPSLTALDATIQSFTFEQ